MMKVKKIEIFIGPADGLYEIEFTVKDGRIFRLSHGETTRIEDDNNTDVKDTR